MVQAQRDRRLRERGERRSDERQAVEAVESDAAVESDPRIDGMLSDRQAARAAKDFESADRIRDELAAEGIEIIDTPEGPRWRRG